MASYGSLPEANSHGERPAAGWDYVLVFEAPTSTDAPATPHQQAVDEALSDVLAALRRAAFSYSQQWIPSDARLLVRLALPDGPMQEKAELLCMRLPLKEDYGAGFLAFERDRAHVFTNDHRRAAGLSYFCPADRAFITRAVLTARDHWGAALNTTALIHRRLLLQAFATHAEPERAALLRTAVYRRWWDPTRPTPLNALRNYFGARVTIYIAWLVFYTRMLLGIAALSVPVYVILVYATNTRLLDWTRLLFGLCLCFWGTYWTEYWKRRNAVLNVKWGLSDFYEDNENDIRPDFQGVDTKGFYCRGGFVNLQDLDPAAQSSAAMHNHPAVRRRRARSSSSSTLLSNVDHVRDVVVIGGNGDADFVLEAPVTGLVFGDLPVFPFSSKKQLKNRIWISAFITGFFALCVGLASFGILFYKKTIIDTFGADSFGNFVPGIATALLISISDPLWKKASLKLTNWENHRTNQSFENSLIVKRFAFQFVSNYISLFYIAFVKPFTPADPCIPGTLSGKPDCMHELESQLTSLVITKATIQQLLELGIPFLSFRIKRWLQRRNEQQLQSELTEPERQQLLAAGAILEDVEERTIVSESKMAHYASTIEDYGELVIQHGYLVMFGLAFPLAALIDLINNVVESRTDVYKMLAMQQRPDADDAADIGRWLNVIHFISTASVMTTAGLVTITSPALQRALPDFIGDSAEKYPAVSFLIFEHILLWIRWGVGCLVSDTPASTFRMLARQEFLIAKCFNVGWKPYFRNTLADENALKSRLG